MAFKNILLSKRLWLQVFYLILAWAIVSVDFNDPTLFNLMYPAKGIQNGAGHFGALIGGTLIELFGPAALLIPWFLIRLSMQPVQSVSSLASRYHVLVILLTSSILHAICEEQFWRGFSESSSYFFFHTGYIGILGNFWIQSALGLEVGSIFLFMTLLFSSVKIASMLPFYSLVYLVKYCLIGFVVIGKKIINIRWIHRFIMMTPRFPHSQMQSQSRKPSPHSSQLEEWPSSTQVETEECSLEANGYQPLDVPRHPAQ